MKNTRDFFTQTDQQVSVLKERIARQRAAAMMGKNRIMIFGPNDDGTYEVEFRTADGDVLSISIPRSETAVIKHFQKLMLHGLVVPGDADSDIPWPFRS